MAFLAHEVHSLRRTSPDGHHEGLPRSKIIVENQGEMLSIEGMSSRYSWESLDQLGVRSHVGEFFEVVMTQPAAGNPLLS